MKLVKFKKDTERWLSSYKLTFNDATMNIENITALNINGKEDHANLSPILVDSENYYMVMSTIDKDDPLKGETFLLRTNKATLEQNTIFMYKEENSTATSPFSLDNSAYIYITTNYIF
ncbi:hypothetical protein [Bacillus paranthracis]|uniref:hypothetical protein n=1 Tax=Bacillus paranthracis TaxID=2026186 RepID=UPI0039A02740